MDKNRPIIWMIDRLGPGGAEQLMPTILTNLAREGFTIRICVLKVRHGNPIANDLEQLGFPVDLLLIPNLRHPLNLFRILKYIRNHQPAILHTQLEFSDILGTLAAKILGIPCVSTLHTLDTFADNQSATWRLKIRWFILRHYCNKILAVSEKTRAHHLESGRLGQHKLVTLYNGLDLSRFRILDETSQQQLKQALNLATESKVIITVAVLREPKGIQYMLKALPGILDKMPNVHYLIVGDGDYGSHLKNLSKEYKIEDHVTFTGRRTDIPALLSISDIFVLPTLIDALPTVLIEALAAGIPIVASNVGGIPEIIENELNGLLVPSKNPDQLATACLRLLQDEKFSKQMIHAGDKIVQQKFAISVQVKNLIRIYKEVSGFHGKE